MSRRAGICAAVFVVLCASVSAQEPAARKAAISFVPPPLEGTLSLGIYDAKGTLVRVLHREAELEDFEIGADALKTTWDGKNNAGEAMPAGKYHARGYAIGDVEVDGIGYFFNDWIADDQSPRIRKIRQIWFRANSLIVQAEVTGTEGSLFTCDENGRISGTYGEAVPIGSMTRAPGKDETVWVIDTSESARRVKQLSRDGEAIRELKITPDDPEPVAIAASSSEDRIFLLEENATLQRVRSLKLLASKKEGEQAVSEWKVEFEKKIVPHKDFRIENGRATVTEGKTPPEKVTVKLQPNTLKKDARETVDLIVAFDREGSVLKTADGLPLVSVSETTGVTRVVLSPTAENAIDVFQDDDAVVEQFRVTKLDQMMAFDAGDFELR